MFLFILGILVGGASVVLAQLFFIGAKRSKQSEDLDYDSY